MSEGKQLSEYEINQLAQRFEGCRVEEVLEWAVDQFSPKLVMTSNFGVDGIVLMDKLVSIARETPIIYLETGFQFAARQGQEIRLASEDLEA